jgi:hypothetical protein
MSIACAGENGSSRPAKNWANAVIPQRRGSGDFEVSNASAVDDHAFAW